MTAFIRLAVLALLLTAMRSEVQPLREPPSCKAGEDLWTQAEAIVSDDEVGGRINGVSAVLGPIWPTGFPTCASVGERHGTNAAWVNLSEYDRPSGRGGRMIQLGVWRRADDPPVFGYSEFVTTGGLVLLPPPLPEQGHTYRLSIDRNGATWQLLIRDLATGLDIHAVDVAVTWGDAQSAWLMNETFGRPARFGGFASASFTDMQVHSRLGWVDATPPCSMSETWYADEHAENLASSDRFAFSPGAQGSWCSSDPFRAFSSE